MPTNEQRRAAAKRKLERQLERRAQQARRRRFLTIVGGSVAAVVVIAVVVTSVWYANREQHKKQASASAAASATTSAPGAAPGVAALPSFTPSPSVGANCQYEPSPEPPAKQVNPPRTGKVPTSETPVSISMVTSQGNISLLLANNESPCTVNSFVSLATQKFFDDTRCHRMLVGPTSGLLQCGDPTGDGTGGPGYQFANEYPTDQYQPDDPKLHEPVVYPRGTLAMANAGPGTNGSQFFMIFKDTQLTPEYTVFGKVQDDGLATLDKIAKDGVVGGGEEGEPATVVTIKSVLPD
ncbi:MAG: peptidylprolyl isomerase [Mycobacterium sp.]